MLCQFVLYSQVNQPYVYLYLFFLFWISFPFRSLQSIKWSSLCYTVGSHYLSIVSYQCIFVNLSLSIHPTLPTSIHMSVADFFFSRLIYLFLAALGLRCYTQALSSCNVQGLLFIAAHGLFTAVDSCCRVQALEPGLSSYGTQAQLL